MLQMTSGIFEPTQAIITDENLDCEDARHGSTFTGTFWIFKFRQYLKIFDILVTLGDIVL